MRLAKQRAISFVPFWRDIKKYRASYLKNDLYAAFAVALMTIPQSIAYSLLAGLPPTAGLFAAIFGTIFTASFGSSKTLVSGPSTGTAILLQISLVDVMYSNFDHIPKAQADGITLMVLMQIVLLIGIIQILAAFFNVSRFLQFVSRPVILGYFGGITVAVIITQIFYLTGVPTQPSDSPLILRAWGFLTHLFEVKGTTLSVGLISMIVLVVVRRYLKNFPYALIMIVAGAIAGIVFNELSIGEPVDILGNLQLPENPLPNFSFTLLDFKILNRVFPSAVAIAFLGILEVYSISRTFAAKTKQKVQINQDIFGLGVSNLLLSWITGAMPSSGSPTRTALSYRLHSKTRFASAFSGIMMGIMLLFFWPFVAKIPLAALAALLISSVYTLMDLKEIRLIFRATKEDALVFSLTLASCFVFSLDIAFFIGIVISIVTFLRKSAMPHLVEYAFNSKGRLVVVSADQEAHRKIRIIGIGGDLYFAAADVFQSTLQQVAEDPNVQAIVLRLNNVHHMDASMCLAILQLNETMKSSGRHLIISGITEGVWYVLHRARLVKELGFENLYFTDESNPQFSTWKAALRAQELVYQSD